MSGRPTPRRVGAVPSPLASRVLRCVLSGLLWVAIGCAEEKPRLREPPSPATLAAQRGWGPDARFTPEEVIGDPGSSGLHAKLYESFLRKQEAWLCEVVVSDAERKLEQAALLELRLWAAGKREEELARLSPWSAYLRIRSRLERQARADRAQDEAIGRKLKEHERWATALLESTADPFRRAGKPYLVTESPLLHASRQALAKATLDWAYSHTADPDFLRKSPSEVAVYLVARSAALSRLLILGELANAHLDYTPELDPSLYTTEELLTEMLIGFIPVLGDAVDLMSAVSGVTLTGHHLDEEDRVLLLAGAVVPLVPGSALRGVKVAPEMVERLALASGRRVEEVEALLRVAERLGVEDARELERLVHVAAKRGTLSGAELESLERIASRLGEPLARAVETLRQSGRASGVGLKVDLVTGRHLVPGSAEHMHQRWIDYQFRYPGKRGVFQLSVDPEWERLYRTILENAESGGSFQAEALAALKYEKNTAMMMMPPPGSKERGFIPDAVKEKPAELVWGQPYHFVEVKARKDLSNGGNLAAMIKYVEDVEGARLTLVVRSAKHPDGPTRITGPLSRRINLLRKADKLRVKEFPE